MHMVMVKVLTESSRTTSLMSNVIWHCETKKKYCENKTEQLTVSGNQHSRMPRNDALNVHASHSVKGRMKHSESLGFWTLSIGRNLK
jgi:hypothetical protein